jgi:hypothetical protein
MKFAKTIIILLIPVLLQCCISNFIPAGITEEDKMLVVEGRITNQPGVHTIRLTFTEPLWKNIHPKPLSGCIVSISDETGKKCPLKESPIHGTYITDPAGFQGTAGKTYTLHIQTTDQPVNYSYESLPTKMIAVPEIDSIGYQKKEFVQSMLKVEGCDIFVSTHDPSNGCKFYRWEFTETWEYRLPFNVPNKVCWKSSYSNSILLKNASMMPEGRVNKFLLNTISDPIDKLGVKYCIEVRQFSLNENEFFYWESLRNTTDLTGGLYDVIPAEIPNNMYCVEDPSRKVLGFFSVSAVSSKRKFIKDSFSARDISYLNCITDSVVGTGEIPNLNGSVWILVDQSYRNPPVRYITTDKDCADCTTRGTNIKPVFWDEDK